MNELENESLYRVLVDTSPDAIVLTDLHATILRANPAAGELFGVDARELIGTSGLALLAPEERAEGTADIRAFLESGAQQNFEYTFLRADGARARVEVRASIWRDALDAPQGFVLIARDITARAHTEAELRASESRYRLLAENISDVIFALDLGLRFTYISASVERLAGYTPAQVIGRTLDEFLTPASMAFVQQLLREDFESGDFSAHLAREVEMRHANGSIIWVETRITFILDAAHKPQGMYGVTRDISARKQFENALRASETRFRTSVENMLDAFGIYSAMRDATGRIVDFHIEYVNAAACASNQLSKDAQIGKRLCEILPAHRATGLFDAYCRVVETGAPFGKTMLTYEDVYDGQRVARAFDVRAVKLGDGFAAAWRDVTETKRAQEELVWRNKELTALNSIISALAQARPRDQMLSIALERTLQAFDLDVGAIYLLDATTGTLAPVAARGIDPAREEIIAAQIRAGVNPASAQFMNDARASFSAVIPLKAKDESVGVMFLFGAQLLDERALQFLLTIGQQIGVAVENARLAEQTREIDVLREMDRLRGTRRECVARTSHAARIDQIIYHRAVEPSGKIRSRNATRISDEH